MTSAHVRSTGFSSDKNSQLFKVVALKSPFARSKQRRVERPRYGNQKLSPFSYARLWNAGNLFFFFPARNELHHRRERCRANWKEFNWIGRRFLRLQRCCSFRFIDRTKCFIAQDGGFENSGIMRNVRFSAYKELYFGNKLYFPFIDQMGNNPPLRYRRIDKRVSK